MSPKKILLIILFLVAKSVAGQHAGPATDSCVVIVRFMSLDKIPYPGRLIVCELANNTGFFAAITDSLGKAEFTLPKDSSLTFLAYNGSLLIGNYPFSIPGKAGAYTMNFNIQEDFFDEDRTGEVLIDTTWANDRKLSPVPDMLEVEVTLTNDERVPIPQTIIIFRDPVSKNVFIGETNEKGTFHILIPKDQQYGVRIAQMGNRFPVGDLSTEYDTLPSLIRLNLMFSQTVENSYSEIIRKNLSNSNRKILSGEVIPDLFTLENMYFDFDKSSLQPASFPELNNLVSVLKRFPEMCIEIRGHTDNFGDDEYNQRLSERRSATVRNYLIECGISSLRIQSAGYGEKFPVQTNETESGRQANRRIEVKVLSR